ncbi:RNA polymerase sigma factor [Tissierella creatinophila]|nr:sigma-70 family RNA polymerase sigma factor [Tissierella creatinophila]
MRKVELEKYVEDYIIEYQDAIYRLAYSYVRNVEDSLDIVQESIFKAFSSIDSLKEPQFIKTWFYRIVVNTSIDFIRKRKREVLVDDESLLYNDIGRIDIYEDIDLEKALNELPNNYRTIIILRYFEDLPLKEIASILGQNINTVKTNLYKGLKKLKININIGDKEVKNV